MCNFTNLCCHDTTGVWNIPNLIGIFTSTLKNVVLKCRVFEKQVFAIFQDPPSRMDNLLHVKNAFSNQK